MKRLLLGMVLLAGPLAGPVMGQNFTEIKPTPQQTAWQDLEFGVILHFGLNTFLNAEWSDGTASPRIVNPTQFDPNQWMDAIKASGATYVVFVAKHHDGFCLWPTDQTDYSIKNSPFQGGKGDIVRDVAKAARAHGLRFGVYLSPWDRHEPKYKDSVAYDAYYKAELEELATRYGDLVEFWLDGAGSAGHVYNFAKIIETLRTYQPNTIVFADTGLFEYGDARWVGNEDGAIPFENWNVIDRHGFLRWRPVEVDTPLRAYHWVWHPHDDASLKSLPDLVDLYEKSVGRGGQWMLGVAPNDQGLLDASDVARLHELGDALRSRYGKNLALEHGVTDENTAKALDGDTETFWSAPEGSHSAVLELRLAHPVTFDQAVTMEWLPEGQNVLGYRIEAEVAGKWVTLAAAQAIGHKKIDAFAPTTASRVRLKILSSAGTARIREFQLYSTQKP